MTPAKTLCWWILSAVNAPISASAMTASNIKRPKPRF